MIVSETMPGEFYFLRIKIDGHLHGCEAPKPWVAHITGIHARYGLARDFVQPMNDWRDAHRAWSGNTYGVVSTFALREGNLYEVSRLRGRGRRRGVVREFGLVRDRKLLPLEPIEALAHAEAHDCPVVELQVQEPTEPPFPSVGEIRRLGMPERMGFVVVDHLRYYRLREGLIYEVEGENRQLLAARSDGAVEVSEREALEHLLGAA